MGKRSGGKTPTFMQALGGLLDGVTASKLGQKVPKSSKNMNFGPGAGGPGLRAEFRKPQKFDKPRGPSSTGSVAGQIAGYPDIPTEQSAPKNAGQGGQVYQPGIAKVVLEGQARKKKKRRY